MESVISKFAFFLVGFCACLECGWAYGLKHAGTPLGWALTILCVVACFFLLMQAFKLLPASICYTLFVGLGTALIVIAEIAHTLFNGGEVNFLRIFFVTLLVTGVIGLKNSKVEQKNG